MLFIINDAYLDGKFSENKHSVDSEIEKQRVNNFWAALTRPTIPATELPPVFSMRTL